MEVTEAIDRRRSIRRFKDEPVPEERLRAILEAARKAPSWEDIQPWHFIVVRDQGMKDKLGRLANQRHVARAPVIIACCGDLSAWDPERVREALAGLGLKEEIIGTMTSNPVLTPALLGKEVVLARTLEEIAIAVAFMTLEAVNQGLGTCIVGAFGNELTRAEPELYHEVKKDLGLPERMSLLSMLTLGYPDEDPPPRPRKDFDAVVSSEKYGTRLG